MLVVFLSGGSSQLETWDPKPRHRHRRAVQGDPDLRARHAHLRIAAADRQADAPPWSWSAASTRPRTITAAAPYICTRAAGPTRRSSIRTSARSRRSCLQRQRRPARLHPDHAARRRRLQQAGRRVPRAEVRLGHARRRQAARRPVPARRLDQPTPTASAKRCGRSSTIASPSRAVRPRPKPTPSPTTRPRSSLPRATCSSIGKEDPKLADRYGRHDFGRHCCLPAGCSKRASRSSRSRTRTTTRITRTSTSTSSSSASSTARSRRCSTTWPSAACWNRRS